MAQLVAVIGAGASIELGAPGTQQITSYLNGQAQNFPAGGNALVLGAIQAALAAHTPSPNFEHVLHTIEAILSLMRSWRVGTVPRFKVVEALLTAGPNPAVTALFDDLVMIDAEKTLFRSIYDLISSASNNAKGSPHWAAFEGFWKQLDQAFDLNVATFNYDTFIEQALPTLSQGFLPIPPDAEYRFSPKQFDASIKRLAHLHGSIQMGYRDMHIDPNRFVLQEDFEDLYFHTTHQAAFSTWGNKSTASNQAGRESIVGPIITGMDKSSKVLRAEPYSSYYASLRASLLQQPRLLIAGYGFGDYHANSLLQRHFDWHGTTRRVVIVDYVPRYEPSSVWAADQPLKFGALARLAGEVAPLSDLSPSHPWVSKDGCVEYYSGGFIDACTNHAQRILAHLT